MKLKMCEKFFKCKSDKLLLIETLKKDQFDYHQ